MIIERTYSEFDLESGKCISCGEESDEILKEDGRCVDCIEADEFFERTMQGLK